MKKKIKVQWGAGRDHLSPFSLLFCFELGLNQNPNSEMSSAESCPFMVPLEIGNCWWLHTADTNDSPWNAFGFTAISTFPINYQLPPRVIIVPGLQMTEDESTAVRTRGMAGWRPGHESSWCLQRPRNFGHLISQNSFHYYSIPFHSYPWWAP